jgi:ABC-2 type transport system ATP-binding protein
VLEIRDLRKRYGDVVALDGTSLSVAPGRIVGFLGPNGAGKTTTMRAIFGLVAPDSGELLWDGEAIGASQRARFGYMPEERGLYPKMKVLEQLRYFAELSGLRGAGTGDAARRWLDRLGLADRAGARLEELSHGNQQRVQLAAALVHDPDLAVLDEPFSGLDPIGVESLTDLLGKTAAEGVAVLFSSHQLDLVEDVCQDVVIIDQGRVVVAGEVEQLKAATSIRSLEVLVDGRPWLPSGSTDANVSRKDGQVRVLLDTSTDLAQILASAQRAGEVTRFSFEPPSLTDLFLQAVAEKGALPR